MAGALNIMLGGPNYYFGKIVYKPKIGDDTEKITLNKVYLVNKILYLSSFLGIILACIISKFIEVVL